MTPRAHRLRSRGHVCLALATTSLFGCALEVDPTAETTSPIVYGDDDRRERFELGDGMTAATVSQAMVALIPRGTLSPGSPDPAARVPTYGTRALLCPGEPFAEQPAAAFCSGVLVDWDLVLTAGHCVRQLALEDTEIVFGYSYESPGRLVIDRADVFRPIEIVAEALDPAGSEPRLDYAWLRLDRPVAAPRQPARVHRTWPPVALDQSIVSIGTPGGVPIKIDDGGRLRALREGIADYFTADTDTSHGSSGGGAFDLDMVLLGVLTRGGTDFVESAQGCYVTARTANGSAAEEEFTYAHRALEGLCADDPGVSTLCRPDCGSPCKALPWSGPPSSADTGCAVAAPPDQPPFGSAALLIAVAFVIARRRQG